MKVFQVHNFYAYPGGECSVVRRERELLRSAGVEVIPYEKHSSAINDLSVAGKAVGFLQIPFNRGVYREVRSILQDHRVDVAHVHNVFPLISPSVYHAIADEGVPIAQTVHNYRPLCPNGQFFRAGAICERCTEKSFLEAVKGRCVRKNYATSIMYAAAVYDGWRKNGYWSRIDRYIALNHFVSDRLINEELPLQRIAVLPNYVDVIADDVSDKREYVLYLGRLSPEKGLFTLLEAAQRVPDVPVIIAGEGPLYNDLAAQIEQRGIANVVLRGYVAGAEKAELLMHAACLIVPSLWYENCPISVLEALSCGTGLVVSRIGGLPELVREEDTGYLFEPGDAVGLAELMQRCSHDQSLARGLGEAALIDARLRFSAEVHLEGLMTIYNQIKC